MASKDSASKRVGYKRTWPRRHENAPAAAASRAELMVQRRQWDRQCVIDRNSRAISGLEDPNTLGRPDQVGAIEDVEQRDSVSNFAHVRHLETSLRAQIDLNHMREGFQVGKTPAQPTAVNRIKAECVWFPAVGCSARGAIEWLMIEHDIVAVDVTQ